MQMASFTSIDDLLSHLRADFSKGERFATRFILAQGREAWDRLILALVSEVDRVVPLSDFCSGLDTFPDMTKVISYLRSETAGCKSVLLTPLAECARLNPESGTVIQTLSEWSALEGLRRIYVPLLAAEEIVFPELERIPRFKAGLLPELWSLSGEGSCEVIVAPFVADLVGNQVVKGIKEYLAMWEQGSRGRVWLVTAMAEWLSARKTRSECRVHLYSSSFDYVKDILGWRDILSEWGTNNQWNWLAREIHEGDSLDRIAGRLLNVAGYQAEQLLAQWQRLDENSRWLVWLWSKVRSNTDSYLHHVLNGNNSVDTFCHDAIIRIFTIPRSVTTSHERKELLQYLGIQLMPSDFWENYHQLPDAIDRMAVLTDYSSDERDELVRCTGELLTGHARELWWEYLEVSCPELTWYMQPAMTGEEFIDQYFAKYNCCRLKDQTDEELSMLVHRWADQQLLWNYPGRSDILARERSTGAKVLWVDAMGMEWTGLLTRLIAVKDEIDCEVLVTRGQLPSTTEANKEWEAGEEVIRGIDDIAHHYEYSFPASFLKEIDVIKGVADKVLALLTQYPTVVITSDHGLSRFAAIGNTKVEPPPGAQVDSRGRYALLADEEHGRGNNGIWVVGEGKAYLLTHDRFQGGSVCRGEVHSGATPEEHLVPVIVVKRVDSATTLPHFYVDEPVKLNPRGEGILTLRCNSPVNNNVALRIAGHVLTGRKSTGLTWSFALSGWKAGTYTAKVIVVNRQADEVTFDVITGLIQEDLGL